MTSWATALIEPNRDFEADRMLRRAGYRVVFLTYRKMLTGHNRPGWRTACDFVFRPLFPGYIFVELWPDEPWPQRKAGYQGLLTAARRPLLLSHETVWGWHMLVRSGEFDDKRPTILNSAIGKFRPANDPDERRRLLAEKFAAMIGDQYAVGA